MTDPVPTDGFPVDDEVGSPPPDSRDSTRLFKPGRRRYRRIPGGTTLEVVAPSGRVEIEDKEAYLFVPLDARGTDELWSQLEDESCDRCRTVAAPTAPPEGSTAGAGDGLPALLDNLAAALRQVRGHVPHHVWWDAGAADALFEYEAKRGK